MIRTCLTRAGLARLVPAVALMLAATPGHAAAAKSESAQAPTLSAYGELPGVVDFALSPDGTKLASVRNVKNELWLIVVGTDGTGYVRASLGAAKVRAVGWADNNTVTLTKSDTVPAGFGFTAAKYELTGTVLIPLDGTGEKGLVFSRNNDIMNTTRGFYGVRTIDGRSVGYYGGIALDTSAMSGNPTFRHGRPYLYAVDIQTNRPRVVARAASEDHWRDWLVDAAGAVAVMIDVDETNGVWRIENARGQALTRGKDKVNGASLICFNHDGTGVIFELTDEDGKSHWYEVPLAGGTPSEFLEGVDVERLYIDRTSNLLLGYRKMGEKPETVMYDPVLQAKLAMIFRAFPDRNVRLMDWTGNFNQVVLRTDGNKDSGTWFFVDVPGRRADPVGDEHAAIPASEVGAISEVDYAAQDGLKLDGVLTLPPGREAKGLPLVVLPHGGPHAADEVGFDWWAQAFASRGYAVFQPNFRGSTGRGDSFRNAGKGEWGRKMQTDISDGVAELVTRGLVDPRRACIVGASYGGYAALAGVTLQHGLYRCAVSVAGVADVGLMYRTDVQESGGSNMTRAWLREDLGDPRGFDAISPRAFAASADAPILLIHGKDDTVVPFKQSLVMADALKDAGKPYEMVVLKQEDHWLSRSETRQQMLEAAVAFVEKNNPAK
ncbi:alpha/beta fold hydrolase [Novosphingobium sp. 1949]|uniref:Alpha/beta fold hydrolase n=1 Tax=Novosphingobium organovorum TaxID=2930092 RepID=A0ABT0BB57_9SPHN|nr:alpha/beta fold hydrolase [Novosphingobium organovorum]MCJ2182292.1 alpha/beta fold hydrolase [Novosphingobium organovorum]